ncbi:MAG TPA: GNAT family N-acetyltransferase [Acidothermaceae bacterium]
MDVRLFNDPHEFASVAGAFLAADPFSTTVIGVRVDGVRTGLHSVADDDLWAAVVDDDVVVGVAMRTPPHPLVLSRMPDGAARELAIALAGIGPLLGANGEQAAIRAFAAAWAEASDSVVDASMRLYRLGALRVPDVNGSARLAESNDEPLILDWLTAFFLEAAPNHPTDDLAGLVGRRVAARQFWLWADRGTPVSLAHVSAPASGVARVGPVYTPPAFRRHGYGAAATAHATQAALDAGADHVVLYTDLANPTSNGIYQALGYVPDHDFEERSFTLV